VADDQAYLDELRARRRTIAGVRSTAFSDQSTTFDQEALDREIARVEAELAGDLGRPRMRFAVTNKGA
jgi:hypothetical protein